MWWLHTVVPTISKVGAKDYVHWLVTACNLMLLIVQSTQANPVFNVSIYDSLSCLQPSQSAFHRATGDILQVGQLASREWQKVSFFKFNFFCMEHCGLTKLFLKFVPQLLPSPLLRGASVGGHTDAHSGHRAVTWFAPGPSRCHGARRSPGQEGCWSSVRWCVRIHL